LRSDDVSEVTLGKKSRRALTPVRNDAEKWSFSRPALDADDRLADSGVGARDDAKISRSAKRSL